MREELGNTPQRAQRLILEEIDRPLWAAEKWVCVPVCRGKQRWRGSGLLVMREMRLRRTWTLWPKRATELQPQHCVPHPQEFEREKHAHSILQFQFAEVKEALRQREEMLEVGNTFSFPFCWFLTVVAQVPQTWWPWWLVYISTQSYRQTKVQVKVGHRGSPSVLCP